MIFDTKIIEVFDVKFKNDFFFIYVGNFSELLDFSSYTIL